MKKTLLLSVVASTLIMAGGDIEPVAVPVVEEVVSGWDFSGQAVLYYQTSDDKGDGSLFDEDDSIGNTGFQLRAVNKDVAYGIGAGIELSGLAQFPFGTDGSHDGVAQSATWSYSSAGWISQAYLTYGFGNTSIKVGRQELPKALSPFAFSEAWNVFKNTFDAALIVNTDITDTTLVGAYVRGANNSNYALHNFRSIHSAYEHAEDGVYMLTAQNKSVENLTLTGTWYYAPDMVGGTDNVNILWGDAKYNAGAFNIAVQGGMIMSDPLDDIDAETTAFGAKIGAKFNIVNVSVAYSSVDDGAVPLHNLGTRIKTPLYTQMIANQNFIKSDSDTFVVRASVKALGGNIGAAYNYSDVGNNAGAFTSNQVVPAGDYTEFDLTYKTKVFNDSTTLFAGYVYQDHDVWDDNNNILRFWGRYNF